jgi:cell division FtsZ-interacting protein ZapD
MSTRTWRVVPQIDKQGLCYVIQELSNENEVLIDNAKQHWDSNITSERFLLAQHAVDKGTEFFGTFSKFVPWIPTS